MNQRITIVLRHFLMAYCCLLVTDAVSQSRKKAFSFPERITTADYSSGHVLVRVKPEYTDVFLHGGPSVEIPGHVGTRKVRAMMPEKSLTSTRLRTGPRRSQSSVDPRRYYEIACEPGRDIEAFINDLYATGYFEVVEPDYVYRLAFVPSDPLRNSQYYLTNVKAFEAWDITQGNENLMIAIVDTGGDLTHPDLTGNLYTNPLDPIDGIDNDNNGYLDDFRGWDFMGDQTININDPDYPGDNNPQLLSGGLLGHGVNVAGCASARANNGIGIAGIGFKTKIMFTKHTADDQEPNSPGIYRGYDGIYYAAIRGAKVINCSWGGSFRSEILQDLITFVTLDLGALVVAAAGNDGTDQPSYPAAYDHVVSVAAVSQSGVKASFTNYGTTVDIAAPGVAIFTTDFGNTYKSTQGTSFSSPIVAGAAALVMAQFPSYTPDQVAEQLRVTSNGTELYTKNPFFIGKLGHGVLDIHAALTVSSPAVRASNPKLLNALGSPAGPGEKGYLTFSFKNLLAATSGALEISIAENSSMVEILKGTIRPGGISSEGTITNNLQPFELQFATSIPDNFSLPLTISYNDGSYIDSEVITFILNPTFIDVDENLITTTVSGIGRIGFEDTEGSRTKGSGFVFDDNSTLFEMGIMMGSGTAQLYNNVRGLGTSYDKDFVSIGSKIKEITPGMRSTSEIFGSISNSTVPASQVFQINYRSLVWKDQPYDKFVIMEYVISNPTANAMTNFYFSLFADWDITQNGTQDAANWDNDLKLGYVYPAQTAAKPHVGIQLLSGTPNYYAIDNDPAVGDAIGLYDGFTDVEKMTSMGTGLARLQAGSSTGRDVSHVVGAGPFTILPGQQVKVAFALHAASNLDDLRLSAKYADSVYNYTLNATVPSVAAVNTCYDTPASLVATGAANYKWYKAFTGGLPFHTGSSLTTGNLRQDTSFFVSNADESYESVRGIASVHVKANPEIHASRSLTICSNESVTLSVVEADSYLWSTGATTRTIDVSVAGDYSVEVGSITPLCQNTSTDVTVQVNPIPTADFSSSGELKARSPIQFTDLSTGASVWFWDFGDGTTSTDQNPTISYDAGQAYDVTLQVTSNLGCQDTFTQSLDVITSLEDSPWETSVVVSPNPIRSTMTISFDPSLPSPRSVQLLTLQGRPLQECHGISAASCHLPAADLPCGIYLVRVSAGSRMVSKKVVKID